MAAGAAIALIVALAVATAIVRRRRRAESLQAPLPLIPFSTASGISVPPRPDGMLRPSRSPYADVVNAATPAWNPTVPNAGRENAGRSPYAPPHQAPRVAGGSGDVMSAADSGALAETARPNEMVSGAAVDGASVRYWRPADGTLQFLPGRLEVIAGRDAGQEIRFVRTPGPDGTKVTFGRAEGAPYRHVQLREPTVSRAHACMMLDARTPAPAEGAERGGSNGDSRAPRWRLENLSATNPVVVNGRPLAADESPASFAVLSEGDRIEMGEVVFRFHEK
jgi:hypothetical protein